MIYAVDQHNRAAYRAQIDEMLRMPHGGTAAYPLSSSCVCAQNGCPACCKHSVFLLDIDNYGRLMSGIVLDLAGNPVAVAIAFVDPESLGGAPNEEWTLCPELTVAMLEYALAMRVTRIDISCNPLLLRTALDLESPLPMQNRTSKGCRASRRLDASYDTADRIREFFAIGGPVLTYAHHPPPYAANENRWLRMVS